MKRLSLSTCALMVLFGACKSSSNDAPDTAIAVTKLDTGVAIPKVDTGVGADTTIIQKLDASSSDAVAPAVDAPPALVDTGSLALDAGSDLVVAPSVDALDAAIDVAVDGVLSIDSAKPVDTAKPDVAIDIAPEVSKPTYDGGLGLSCIKGLFGTYVLRWDGILIDESKPASPQTVFEASTGLPLTGVVSVQDGTSHGCAVLQNGSVECWQTNVSAGNVYGQQGNGTTTAVSTLYRATPVITGPAVPLANAVAMAPGAYSNTACAVSQDGKLWCWGDLAWVVNKGKTLESGYAQAITTDGATPFTGVVAAALGPSQACSLVSGTPNTVWCWGSNAVGELGQGDTVARQYPIKVLGLANPSKIAMAANYSNSTVCVQDGDAVKCWGVNGGGAAGVNVATSPILSPTTVVMESGAALSAISDLSAGDNSFSVLRTGGTFWTWGWGYQKFASNYGQTNVLAVGWAGPAADNGPRFLTSDGVYHNGTTIVNVNCNTL